MKNSAYALIISGLVFLIILGVTFYYQNNSSVPTAKNTAAEVVPEAVDDNTSLEQLQNDNVSNESVNDEAESDNNTGVDIKNIDVGDDSPVDNTPSDNNSDSVIPNNVNSTDGSVLMQYNLYEVAENSAAEKLEKFSKEDPLGKVVGKTGEQLRKDANKIKGLFTGSSENTSTNKSKENDENQENQEKSEK